MLYSDTHEWISYDEANGIATVGITDYAQKELGDIVYVELSQKEKTVTLGEEVVILESTKAAVDLYTPLSGTIIEANTSLRENPEKINNDPTGEGWLFKIKISNPSELEKLLDEQAYENLLTGN